MSNDKIIKCRVKSDSTFTDLIGYDLLVVRDKAFYRIDTIISEQLPINLFKKYCGFLIGREQLDLNVYDHREELAEVFKGFKEDNADKTIEPVGGYIPFETVTKKGSEDTRVYESGAKRASNKNKPFIHNLQPYTLLRFGYLTNMGAREYGDGNFLKGFPNENAIESLLRHITLFRYGDTSEDHLSSALFNIQLLILNQEKEGIKPDHWFKYEK